MPAEPAHPCQLHSKAANAAGPRAETAAPHAPGEPATHRRRSAFRWPLLSLPAGMFDDRVRPREYQARVTVIETHQVRRLPAPPADFDDLADPVCLAHNVARHPQPVSAGS